MLLFFDKRLVEYTSNFDICNEDGRPEYTVEGDIVFGGVAKVYSRGRKDPAMITKKPLAIGYEYEVYYSGAYVGSIRKKETFFGPKFVTDYKSWSVKGDPHRRNYSIQSRNREMIATVHQKTECGSYRYSLGIDSDRDALDVVLIALVIDAEKYMKDILDSQARRRGLLR